METVKTTLTLEEILFLEAEIGGVANQTGIISKGLLQLKLPIGTKYRLNQLFNSLQEDKKFFNEQREELIKSFGTNHEDGSIEVEQFTDKTKTVLTPKYIEYSIKLRELLTTEREVEHVKFSLDDFKDIETESNFAVLFKLIG